jgi:hypothetical protein
MSLDEATVKGTAHSEGTLELDQTPNVSLGRVQVTIKPIWVC